MGWSVGADGGGMAGAAGHAFQTGTGEFHATAEGTSAGSTTGAGMGPVGTGAEYPRAVGQAAGKGTCAAQAGMLRQTG